MCIGNCYACPYACNVNGNKKRPHSYIVSEPVEAEIATQADDIDEVGLVPVYEVKKTITGKLKGVLKGGEQ